MVSLINWWRSPPLPESDEEYKEAEIRTKVYAKVFFFNLVAFAAMQGCMWQWGWEGGSKAAVGGMTLLFTGSIFALGKNYIESIRGSSQEEGALSEV